MDRSTERSAGGHGTHANNEVEELLLRIRGHISASAILEQDGATELELAEHRLEIDRLRCRLANLMSGSSDMAA
jgi:hypothetical protein